MRRLFGSKKKKKEAPKEAPKKFDFAQQEKKLDNRT